jgi:membrane-associated protein
MDFLKDLFHTLTDVEGMIRWGGYTALGIIVFVETGLMIGFFLPGDSLLVTAGVFAAKGDLDIWVLNLLLIPLAIAGDATGYYIGKKLGPALFKRPKSRLFNPRHLVTAQLFYERHGGKTIVIARFVPILRTFAPVVAGIGRMTYRRFFAFNVFGGAGWVLSMTLLGYGLGLAVPNLDEHIEWIILLVIFLSILPSLIAQARTMLASRASARRLVARIEELTTAIRTAPIADDATALRGLGDAIAAIPGEEIRTGIVHEHPPLVAVTGPATTPERLEVTVESSAPTAELTEAARQVAQWKLEESFVRASSVISGQLGEAQPMADAGSASGYHPLRAAVWQLGGGASKLALLLHARGDERLRLSLLVERPGASA